MTPYCFAANNPIRLIDYNGQGPGDVLVAFGGGDVMANGNKGVTAPALATFTQNTLFKTQGGVAESYSSAYWSVGLGNEKSLDDATQKAYDFIKTNYNKQDGVKVEGGKIIIYGYSQGGVLAQHLAARLKADNIKVDLLITVDAASGPMSALVNRKITDNVKVNMNYFHDRSLLDLQLPSSVVLSEGEANKAENPQKTDVINNDLTSKGETHASIAGNTLEEIKDLVKITVNKDTKKKVNKFSNTKKATITETK